MDFHNKYIGLKEYIRNMGSLAVAFSGGVDSTFLLRAAYDVLGDNVLAITAKSAAHPEREYIEALRFAEELGVSHITIVTHELELKEYSTNPPDRCYICKKAIFSGIFEIAAKHGIQYVADGTNFDDGDDYRPGMAALSELGVVSPLMEARLTKNDIRELSREMGLPTWEKQSFACLASRIPYGQEITKWKLQMVDSAEQYLLDLGFKQVRVRHHGDIARIEVLPEDRGRFDAGLMDMVHKRLKDIGFKYVVLDLKGYRTGSLNEVL